MSVALTLPVPAPAASTPPLLCPGTAPPVLRAVRPGEDGPAQAILDHLGHATFDVAPMPAPGLSPAPGLPLPGLSLPGLPAPADLLDTAGGPLDGTLAARACPAPGMEFPVTARRGVPAAGGTVPWLGCRIRQDG